jgi:hypothetical protein
MRKSDVRVGDWVVAKAEKPAYYSGYAGNPVCKVQVGELVRVGATNVPRVRGRNTTFVCVDFVRNGQTWRAALDYDQIRRPTRAEAARIAVTPVPGDP